MLKPARKNPGLNVWEGSPQGRMFISLITSCLGRGFTWEALARTKDKRHIFRLTGPEGSGLLVESQEQAEGNQWTNEVGFHFEPIGIGSCISATLIAHRWDPWLDSQLTGDRSLVDGPANRRYKVQAERDEETGRSLDEFRLRFGPNASSPHEVVGIPLSELASLP